ncbi:MAG: plastocyanin [Bacteroidia bacterium]|jgi:plastocyanin
MKTLLLFSFSVLTCSAIQAQTLHNIEAGGGPAPAATPYYAPQSLTIEIGDTVRWTNVGGTHNVDGSLPTFPSNPEGFRNGNPSNSLWVFDHVFTTSGFYEFECEAFDHNLTQFGNITVNNPAGVNDQVSPVWEVYPNPTTDYLRIRTQERITRATLYSIEMKKVADLAIESKNSEYGISLTNTPTGIYILECDFDGTIAHQKIIVD